MWSINQLGNRRQYPDPSRVVIYVIENNFFNYWHTFGKRSNKRGHGLNIYLFTFVSNRFWVFIKLIFYPLFCSRLNISELLIDFFWLLIIFIIGKWICTLFCLVPAVLFSVWWMQRVAEWEKSNLRAVNIKLSPTGWWHSEPSHSCFPRKARTLQLKYTSQGHRAGQSQTTTFSSPFLVHYTFSYIHCLLWFKCLQAF